jgi:hypothetical protein
VGSKKRESEVAAPMEEGAVTSFYLIFKTAFDKEFHPAGGQSKQHGSRGWKENVYKWCLCREKGW